MPPKMTTRIADRPAASRGGGTGGRAGRGGGRTRGRSGDQGNGDQGRSEGNDRYQTVMSPMTTSRGGAIVYTCWIKKMELVQDISGCRDSQKVKYTAVTPKGKRIERYVYGLALQIRGMVAATKPKTIQKAMQIAGTLNDKALRNGSIKKNYEKRGNGGEHNKDRNVRYDNKRTRTGNAYATTTNPVGRENTGCGNQENQARGRAFMLGAEKARQDPNIMKGIELSDLGFSYEIEKASEQLVEIDKAEIICHEKMVRIPLLDGKALRVLGEKPIEKVRQLMSAKAKGEKQEEVVEVKDFPKVFPDDLSGLPPVWEIEFQIELVYGAMPVAKSSYRLAPFELEDLSGQLKEL
nr:hypothetical protein [Tanacetum cinerariifolium]